MTAYALVVHYVDEDPVRIALGELSPDDAENARQSLVKEVEEANELHAPLIFSAATAEHREAGTPIDPKRVTSIDLVEA